MNRTRSVCIWLFVLILLTAGGAAARDVVPAPVDGGVGPTVLPEDNLPPYGRGPFRRPEDAESVPAAGKAGSRSDDIGGDDIDLAPGLVSSYTSLDIDSSGRIYAAVSTNNGTDPTRIEVLISQDGGMSFETWGTIEDAYTYCTDPDLKVVEGAHSGCYVVYQKGVDIELVSSPLGGASAAFGTPVAVFDVAGTAFSHPRFDTDSSQYSDFYIYVVANAYDDDGYSSIRFARSTDQGANFETPYKLAELLVDDRAYTAPDISYGYGGHLHVVWHFVSLDESFDASIRYRRGSNCAGAGLGDWEYWRTMTSTSDGLEDKYPIVHAAQFGNEVMIAYSRFPGSTTQVEDARVFVSDDAGVSFGSSVYVADDVVMFGDIAEDSDADVWHIVGKQPFSIGTWQVPASDLTDWGAPLLCNDDRPGGIVFRRPDVALDPAHGDRPAWVWHMFDALDEFTTWFDAEWRADPGWPNLEPGFPIGLWAPPLSPPALVDVDGDPELEIVFSDELNRIQVVNPDGSSVPGWPVDVGVGLSDGPVAVGDLDGDGEPALVVGGSDGNAYAYDPDGNLLPGWPASVTPPGHDVYVSIGALGGPYPRTVVCAGYNYITLRSHHGDAPPNTAGWSVGSDTHIAPACIGDIDGDGVAEVVAAVGSSVIAFERGAHTLEFGKVLPAVVSDALTLADLDLDGDLEILCPTMAGVLHVLDHAGNSVGGNFPYDTGNADALTSVAVAQFRDTVLPDLAFGHRNWTVYALLDDGTDVGGYPVSTTPYWFVHGAPVIGPVNGSPSDVLIGDRGERAWAWTNVGYQLGGWPLDVTGMVNVSPAIADIDLDGSVEAVLLTDAVLVVADLNARPTTDPARTWPMYGYDPRRTGCADCAEDLATAVDPIDGITRVSFAGATPNPVSGATSFAFAVPRHAAVDLEIVDLRGRRVYTVFREEMEAGERIVGWNGTDASGRPVASGQYFARLRARGPGFDEALTRKLVVVR